MVITEALVRKNGKEQGRLFKLSDHRLLIWKEQTILREKRMTGSNQSRWGPICRPLFFLKMQKEMFSRSICFGNSLTFQSFFTSRTAFMLGRLISVSTETLGLNISRHEKTKQLQPEDYMKLSPINPYAQQKEQRLHSPVLLWPKKKKAAGMLSHLCLLQWRPTASLLK